MSTVIDNRVVEMRFDNRNFESNVSQSMSTLEKLKKSLRLEDSSKGFENISRAAKNCDMSGLSKGIEECRMKFSAMQIMGITALANITNSAVNAGMRMAKALTIEPVMSGFQEYETQLNSVQTILANTQSKGSTLNDVNKALDTLNTYADKTIYNFTEMTRNIGTFTAAGIDLDTSVSAIQGIANLAAISGSTSQQASTAMYQLSQALASGTVKLMDWNSVVNAGMGGQVFQDALKKTSEELKTGAEAAIKAEGSFRESLQKGWLTSEVLTETLKKFTTSGANEYVAKYTGLSQEAVQAALTEAEARYGEADAIKYASEALAEKSGKNAGEIKEALQMAKTAEEAATKVKTFSQLWDTLKEAAQSGWTQSWEIIIGDFEEAKEFLTRISDGVGSMIGTMSDARNKILLEGLSSGWKQLLNAGIDDEEGYKESIKSTVKDHGVAIDEMIKDEGSFEKALKKGLETGKISSDMMSESVFNLAEKIRGMSYEEREAAGYTQENVDAIDKLEKGLKNGSISMEEFTQKMIKPSGRENIIESLFNSAKALVSVVTPIKEAFGEIFPTDDLGDKIYRFSERLREFTSHLSIGAEAAEKIKRTFKGVFSVLDIGKKVVSVVAKAFGELISSEGVSRFTNLLLDVSARIGDFFTSLNKGFNTGRLSDTLSKIVSFISDGLIFITEKLEGFGDEFSSVGDIISSVGKFISSSLDAVIEKVGSFGDGFSSIGDIVSSVGDFVSKVAGKILNVLKEVFGWISENVSIGDIFAGLAGASAFSAAKKFADILGTIKEAIEKLFGKGGKNKIIDIVGKFGDVLDSLHESLSAFTTGIKTASLVSIAIAIGILTASLNSISKLKVGDISKSLLAIGIMLGMLTQAMKSVTKSLSKFKSKGIIKAGISMILIAKAVDVLSNAIVKLSDLSLAEIAKGLIAVGGGMAELCTGIKFLGGTKVPISTSISMLALAKSCEMLGDAMKKFSGMQWDEIGRGLTGMGGALAEMVASLSVLSKFGGGGALLGSIGILIAVQSLGKMAEGLKSFATMRWDEIKRGLSAMGGALGELGITLGALGKIAGFSSIFASVSILITVQTLKELANGLKVFAAMQWDEIGRGLAGMGGALGEVAGITGALGKLAGFSAIFGSGAIFITIQGLEDLASAFQSFAGMSWEEIGKGLVGMGGALLEVGGITGALGYLTGFAGLLGGGTLLLAVQGLGDLADGFKKFGEMTWEEIKRGLVGMGGALLEIEGITGALGYLTGFAGLLGSGSLLLAVQGLGDIADALKKIGEMSWDEIKNGLVAMGAALGEVALGGLLNTLSGLGAMAISEIAKPLGDLADSVKKWQGVTVPKGLGGQLGVLASGILSFTFDGAGANALATAAPAVGILADSVKKWTGVSVPEGLGTQIGSLADGISKYTFGGFGTNALATAAPAIGDLAISVRKWSTVTVPENIETDLTKIANGIKAFSLAFMGGWSISALIDPLAALPESIKKWNDISVPENIETDLSKIANGVKSFSFAFMGGWTISALIEPLGNLASSVLAWKNVSIPEGIGDKLSSLADGVKSFSTVGDISTTVGDVSSLVSSLKKLANINYQYISSGFSSLITSLNGLKSIDSSVSGVGNTIVNELMTPIKKASSQFSSIGKTIGNSLTDSVINGIRSKSSDITSAATSIMNSLAVGLNNQRGRVINILISLVSTMTRTISSKASMFANMGSILMGRLSSGIASQASRVRGVLASSLSSAAAAVRDYYGSFYASGSYLAQGFANGIKLKAYLAKQAAKAMAKAAADAIKDTLGIESPAKEGIADGVYLAQGFCLGIKSMTEDVSNSGSLMASAAVTSMHKELTKGVKETKAAAKNLSNEMVKVSNAVSETITDVAETAKKFPEWMGSGFINGIGKIIPKAAAAAADLASMTYGSLQKGLENGNEEVLKKLEEFGNSVDEVAAEAARNIVADRGRNIDAENEYWRKLMEARQNGEEAAEYAKKNAEQKAKAYLDFEKSVANEATQIVDNYIYQMNSKQDSIMNSTSLFSKVNEVEDPVDKYELTQNLKDQITELEKFNTVVASLDTRLSGTALSSYIKSLNVSSLTELQALNDMTDDELSNYVQMYDKKFELAGQAAVTQLTEYTAEAEGKLSELFGGAAVNIDTFIASFDGTMETIKAYVANSTAIAEVTEQIKAKIVETLASGIATGSYEAADASGDMIRVISETIKQEVQTESPTKPVEEAFAATAEGAYDYGAYTAEGYAEGLESEIDLIRSAISKALSVVTSVTDEELDIDSPSKVMFKKGAFTGEGFVLGLQSYSDKSRKAAEEIGESAKLGLSRAIEKVYSIADMDVRPVISPVLDMSAVEEGAAGIGSMFGNPVLALGDLSNIRAVKSLMSQRNQNGDAHDIVSAIDKLRGELGNVGGTTYRIDGITYDDGSNISEAVKSLVRAAKVERRV